VYNAHVWIFNNPDSCIGTPAMEALGLRCAALVDQFEPGTLSSLVSFGGFVPSSSGRMDLLVNLRIGEGLPLTGFFASNGSFTNVVNGPGLTDPVGAEIQLYLARKGPVQEFATLEQFHTMFGACGPDFTLPPLRPDQLREIVRMSPVGRLR
jgi:hypothetical protein